MIETCNGILYNKHVPGVNVECCYKNGTYNWITMNIEIKLCITLLPDFYVDNWWNILVRQAPVPVSDSHSSWYTFISGFSNAMWTPNHRESQKTRFMGPTWGPPRWCRSQVGPMMVPINLPIRVLFDTILHPLWTKNQHPIAFHWMLLLDIYCGCYEVLTCCIDCKWCIHILNHILGLVRQKAQIYNGATLHVAYPVPVSTVLADALAT